MNLWKWNKVMMPHKKIDNWKRNIVHQFATTTKMYPMRNPPYLPQVCIWEDDYWLILGGKRAWMLGIKCLGWYWKILIPNRYGIQKTKKLEFDMGTLLQTSNSWLKAASKWKELYSYLEVDTYLGLWRKTDFE